ncbi:MAG: AAA family ATPase, partial [Verrucomicrobia bacterium]|nr:AAA family ATPase [Verrucomicrobiota bacterium]
GTERIHQAETWGPSSQVEFLTKNLLTPATLRLKVGSRVMFTVNRPDSGFVNGQTGQVVEVRGTGVTVETHGGLIDVEPFTWLFDQADRSAGAFKQYPLRLANGVTIHKAQGLSLDAAFIDIRAAREPGQAYVALSRVRSLAGLHLKDWPRGIFVSQRALDFQAACRADLITA